jgi:hypothetical protein
MCQAQIALKSNDQVQIATRLAVGTYETISPNPAHRIWDVIINQPSVAHTYSIMVDKARTNESDVICFTLPVYGCNYEDIRVQPNEGIENSFFETFQTILNYENIGSKGSDDVNVTKTAQGTWVVTAREAKNLIDCVGELANQELIDQLTTSYNQFMTLNQGSPILSLPVMVYLQDTRESYSEGNRCFVSYIVPEGAKIIFPSTENNHISLEIPDVVKMECLFIWGSNFIPDGKHVLRMQDLFNSAKTDSKSVIHNENGHFNWLMPTYIEGFLDISSNINNGFITIDRTVKENTLKQYADDYDSIGNITISSLK